MKANARAFFVALCLTASLAACGSAPAPGGPEYLDSPSGPGGFYSLLTYRDGTGSLLCYDCETMECTYLAGETDPRDENSPAYLPSVVGDAWLLAGSRHLYVLKPPVPTQLLDDEYKARGPGWLMRMAPDGTARKTLPLPEGAEALQQHIRFLPPGLRMFALYVQAHYTYLLGDHSKSAGIVEAAFAMQTEVFPIPAIYMHMVAVMDYMSLKQPERAQAHLLASWELAQPDDLIEPFGEHHGLLGGMLEAVLKKDWPEDFKRIIAITYRFSAGWRKIHNPVTGDHIADNLTTTEFATAMLAVRGWTNQEIAAHLGVSPNTVKQHISSTLLKLGIKQRKDLKRYMLR